MAAARDDISPTHGLTDAHALRPARPPPAARQGSGRCALLGAARLEDLARAAGLSRANFSGEFRRAFGESPRAHLLTRRVERAAALLRTTDRSVADICFTVGLQSVGSFSTSFTRTYGTRPTARSFPPAAAHGVVPTCIVRASSRPQRATLPASALRRPRLPVVGLKSSGVRYDFSHLEALHRKRVGRLCGLVGHAPCSLLGLEDDH